MGWGFEEQTNPRYVLQRAPRGIQWWCPFLFGYSKQHVSGVHPQMNVNPPNYLEGSHFQGGKWHHFFWVSPRIIRRTRNSPRLKGVVTRWKKKICFFSKFCWTVMCQVLPFIWLWYFLYMYTCHSSNNLEASYPGLPLNQRPHFPESVDANLFCYSNPPACCCSQVV